MDSSTSNSESEIQNFIENIVAVDHHCHNVLGEQCLEAMPLVASFCEGAIDANSSFYMSQSKSTLVYRRSIKELAALYGIPVTGESGGAIPFDTIDTLVEAKRRELGLQSITQISFSLSKLESIILDDALTIHYDNKMIECQPSSWHSQFTKVYKVLRLETILEQSLVLSKANGNWSFNQWIEHLQSKVTIAESQLDSDGIEIVGFKSILAYRGGLAVEVRSPQLAESEYQRILSEDSDKLESGSYRVSSKVLIDYFLRMTLAITAQRSKPLPIQIHTGYGDSDLDLEKSNPLLLKPLIVEFPTVPIVLLHCSYPYSREGAFLCWIYPNVYIDTGLAIPILSQRGMLDTLASLMEICPIDKIIYSSDSHHIPELYYLASKWARKCLAQILQQTIDNKEITLEEAKEFSIKIFRDNVLKLYNMSSP